MRQFLILLCLSPLAAQTIEIPGLAEAAPLAGMWKEKVGDDLRWSSRDFDDSSWAGVQMPRPSRPGHAGYTWHRIHLQLPDSPQPRFVMIGPLYGAYEVFANGERIGSFGAVGTLAGLRIAQPAVFPLPAASRIVVAIRSWDRVLQIGAQSANSARSTSWIGPRDAVEGKAAQWELERHRAAVPVLVVGVVLIAGGLFFLVVPFWRGHAYEYLWGGLLLALLGLVRLAQIVPGLVGFSHRLSTNAACTLLDAVMTFAFVKFCSVFFRTRPGWLVWLCVAYQWTGCLLEIPPFPEWLGKSNSAMLNSINLIWMLANLGIYGDCLRRRNPDVDQQGSLWPLHAGFLAWTGANIIVFSLALLQSGFALSDSASLLEIVLRSFVLLFLFGLGIVLNQRAGWKDREEERLRQELEAASGMQAAMLPQSKLSGVEAVYLPAAEVGGDFYQVLPRNDGSQLVVLGDVSGKGLKAAMVAAAAVGALRHSEESSPAQVLGGLNRTFLGQTGGGFVTCCCVRLAPDGQVTLSSAGHASPYWSGQEIRVEAGLPLGLVADASWQEAQFALPAGEQITIVSDGVVEAANAQGELFGFERTREMSGQSAEAIAEAARAWGQNDDITVVTVRSKT